MEFIVVVLVLFVACYLIIHNRFLKQDSLKESTYKKKGPLLNTQESTFYNALRSAVGDHGIVMSKVLMSAVVTPSATDKKRWFIAQNRIAKTHFDFVVCDARTLQVRVAIELDSGVELTKGKIERQKLLIHACKSANIPLIGTSMKHTYQVGKLRRLLAAHIDLIEPEKEIRFCKRCSSPMVIKTASQGEFKGHRFFTCSRQPHCTYTENYNVVFDETT
ncbi:DUF2726 domain-containing protein [Vibrio sinensis]|uniref:DUF2726 domain-containing protein n=1 Tax=Vibrio sinensis TaxID=2302434 RepID=A0A3A6QH74_9VIBR|nr:DUF2726 domain-containing protein [Vibrio sinensis]RJX65760.1 DUF2726 domain-containing protein [Vibrio sinensis]